MFLWNKFYLEHPPITTDRIESKLCIVVDHHVSVIADSQLRMRERGVGDNVCACLVTMATTHLSDLSLELLGGGQHEGHGVSLVPDLSEVESDSSLDVRLPVFGVCVSLPQRLVERPWR